MNAITCEYVISIKNEKPTGGSFSFMEINELCQKIQELTYKTIGIEIIFTFDPEKYTPIQVQTIKNNLQRFFGKKMSVYQSGINLQVVRIS